MSHPQDSMSDAAKAELYAEASGDPHLMLLKVKRDDLPSRAFEDGSHTHPAGERNYVNDGAHFNRDETGEGGAADVWYEGVGFTFQRAAAGRAGQGTEGAQLVLQNVDRTLVQQIEAVRTADGWPKPFDAEFRIVLASEPDTSQRGPWTFQLHNMRYQEGNVVLDLRLEPILTEPYPAPRMDPENAPGLFVG